MEMLRSLFSTLLPLFFAPLALYEDPPGGGGQSPEPSPAPEPPAGQDPPPGGDNPENQDPPPPEPVQPPADPDYEKELSDLINERGHKGVILEMNRKTEDLVKAHNKVKELEGKIQTNKPLVVAGSQRTSAKEAIEAYRKKMEEMEVDQRYIDANIELAGSLSQGFTPEETARIRKNVYGGDLDETINKLKADPNFKLPMTRLETEFRKLAATVPPKYWSRPDIMCKYLGELNCRIPIKSKGGGGAPPPPVEPHVGGGGGHKGTGPSDAEVRKYAEENSIEISNQVVFDKTKRSMIAERNAKENQERIQRERENRK
jgi:hypothetical protein